MTSRRGRGPALALLASVGVLLALLASAFAGGVAADAATTPTPSPTTSKAQPIHTATTFTIGLTQDIDSTNPFTGIAAASYEIYQLQYDTITGYAAKDFSTVPSLAESWSPSANGLVWTFHLRPGVRWSDGTPLTASDVAYTFNRVIKGTYEQTNWFNYVANVTKVVATDPTTVVVTVKKPTPVMYHISIPILPEHIWSKISEKAVANFANEPTPGHPIVGSGPFMLTQVVKGQFIRMERNPYYWGPPTHIDHLVFRVFNNQDSMAQALQRGEIDFADSLDPGVFNALKSNDKITTVDAKYSGFDEIAMNTGAALDDGTPIGNGNPALKDVRVRQAISYAMDMSTIVKKVYGGYGQVGSSIIPPIYANLHYDPGPTAYTFDLAKANQILDAAGYTKGSDGIRRDPNTGKELNFRLYGRSSSDTSEHTVQYAAGWLKQIGIATTLKMVSEDALTEFIGQGNYDMFEWGWVVEPDPDYQLSTFTCASRSYKDSGTIYANLSDSFYCNKEYDALYAQQATQINLAQRTATVKQMQKMLYDAAPYAITAYYDDLEAYRSDRWTNFRPQPAAGADPTKYADRGGALFFQYGTYSYSSIIPLKGDHTIEGPTPAQAGGVVGGIALLWALGYGVTRWRRPPQDEVE